MTTHTNDLQRAIPGRPLPCSVCGKPTYASFGYQPLCADECWEPEEDERPREELEAHRFVVMLAIQALL